MSLELIAPNGTKLDLEPGTRIQLNLKQPVFNIAQFEGSYSYTFTLPLTPANRLYFGFPEEVSSLAGYVTEYQGFKLKSGLIEFAVKLSLTGVVGNKLNANVFSAAGALATTMSVKLLTALTMAEYNLQQDFQYIKSTFTADPGTIGEMAGATILWDDASSTHYEVEFTGDIEQLMRDFADAINTAVGERAKAFAYGTSLMIYDPLNGDTKRLDVNTLNQPADVTDAGYFTPDEFSNGISTWTNNVTAMAGFMSAKVLYGAAANDFTFFPIHNPQFSPDETWCGIVNYWRQGVFYPNPYTSARKSYRYACSAQVNVGYTIQALMTYLGKEAVDMDGIFTDEFFETLYLFSNWSNDRNIKGFDTAGYYVIDPFVNLFRVADSLPPISMAKFLNGLRSYLFMGVWFDAFTDRVIFRNLKDLLVDFDNAIDLTGLVGPFTDGPKFEDPEGFTLSYTHDGGDGAISENLRDDLFDEQFTILDPVATFADLPAAEENQLVLVLDEDKYYLGTLLFENITEWKYFSKNLYGKKIGDGKTSYQPACSTPLMYTGHDWDQGPGYEPPLYQQDPGVEYQAGQVVQDEDGNFFTALSTNSDTPLSSSGTWDPTDKYVWQIPLTIQGRNSRYFPEKNKCSLRLVSYAGVVQNPESETEGDVYPLATNDRGSLGSLKIDGEFGLYETRGKEWIDFLSKAKKVTTTLPMDVGLLNRLKPWLLVKIGNQYYVQGSIKANLPFESGLGEITLFSINITVVPPPPARPIARMVFSTTVISEEDLNTALGITVEDYSVLGLEVSFKVPGDTFTVPANAFIGNAEITEVEFPQCTAFGSSAFQSCTALTQVTVINLVTLGAACLALSGIQNLDARSCTFIDTQALGQCAGLVSLDLRLCANFGGSSAYDAVFEDVPDATGATVTVPEVLQTNDGGDPDGDLVYFTSLGGTVAYV